MWVTSRDHASRGLEFFKWSLVSRNLSPTNSKQNTVTWKIFWTEKLSGQEEKMRHFWSTARWEWARSHRDQLSDFSDFLGSGLVEVGHIRRRRTSVLNGLYSLFLCSLYAKYLLPSPHSSLNTLSLVLSSSRVLTNQSGSLGEAASRDRLSLHTLSFVICLLIH